VTPDREVVMDRVQVWSCATPTATRSPPGCAGSPPTAFVARPGKVLDPLVEAPDVIGADLAEVADRIIETDGGAVTVPR
jgi:hypothetical protein